MKNLIVERGIVAAAGPTGAPAQRRSTLTMALRGAALCLALGFGAAPVTALAETRIVLRVAPPAMQVEEVPQARRGHVWAPGYWRWQNRQHVWSKGHWVRERRGQRFEGARWEQRGERYQFAPARWQRDGNRGARRERVTQ